MQIKAIRGMEDVLPEEINRWVTIETLTRDLFAKYGYAEIRTPIIEETSLFKRAVGDTTDIVQKQMYTFSDRGERSITLRPEGTAPIVRAYLEHSLDKKKLFYIGPMFRSERPQAGRQRQFHQIGIEAIGSVSPYLDAEVISLAAIFLKKAGIKDFTIKLNSLGCGKDKSKFAELFKKKLETDVGSLCEDCQTRFEKNVFRVLDCKNSECKKIVGATLAVAHKAQQWQALPLLCKDCDAHFEKVKECLDLLNVKYVIDDHLVRGLDYYTKTVFEVTSVSLGAQDAVAAGGRYDNLVKDLGGPDMPAVGFAIGIERLLMAQADVGAIHELPLQKIYIATLGEAARKKAFELADQLRSNGIACQIEYDEKSLKAQLRSASNLDCTFAAILGDDELRKSKIILRDMSKSEQTEIDIDKIVEYIKEGI